jgi:ABC-type transport system substrate-binding protein
MVEQGSRVIALQANEVDLITTGSGETIGRLRDLHADGKVRLTELTKWTGTNLIVFNNQVAPTNDFRVRKALQLVTDRALINRVANRGTAILADAPFGRGDVRTDSVWPALDPVRAKALIDEVVQRTGRPVELTLTVSAGSDAVAMGELLQSMWRPTGVNVKVAPNDGGNTSNIIQRGLFQASFAGGLLSSVDPDEMRRYFYSDPAPIGTPTGNWPHIDDAIIDAAFDQIHGNSDPVVRARAANAIVRAIADQAYVIFTTYAQHAQATSPKVAFADVVLPDGSPWWVTPTGALGLAFAYRV